MTAHEQALFAKACERFRDLAERKKVTQPEVPMLLKRQAE